MGTNSCCTSVCIVLVSVGTGWKEPHYRGSQGACLKTGWAIEKLHLCYNTFWIIKLHNACAAAQSRGRSLLLALGPLALGLLALGTCSVSYTMLSSCCGQVGNGLFCFIFVSYLGIFLDWSVNWISWTYPKEHLASVQESSMELEEGQKGMHSGNTPVVSQLVAPVKPCSWVLNSL